MEQLLCHLVGDYFLQSDWMALNKNKKTIPCLVHVIFYTIIFLFITNNIQALSLIALTHFIIDRWSIAKYIIYIKNFINPTFSYYSFDQCSVTGYYDSWRNPDEGQAARPKFITTWLYIISDNTLHLLCNFIILKMFNGGVCE